MAWGAAGWPQHPGDSVSSAGIPFLPALELQRGTAETPDDTGSGNSRTEQLQGTADRIIVTVVANKNANKCTLRKNGLHVNKYPSSLWPVSYSVPHLICQSIHCFREMIKTPNDCK